MPPPDVPQPALTTLSHERSWDAGWIYERKLDGQRCLAVRTGRGTRLYSRSGRDVTVAFPEIAEALEQQAADQFVVAEICDKGWECLNAKRADAPYAAGRTDRWLKFKCEAGQELVVVGWTDPTGSRVALGALLLGYHRDDDLVYPGKVGTGFSREVLRDLHRRLRDLERDGSPCTSGSLPTAGVHWAEPELVAEVAFTEWTRAGQLRHPRYLGLRTDKMAKDVVRE